MDIRQYETLKGYMSVQEAAEGGAPSKCATFGCENKPTYRMVYRNVYMPGPGTYYICPRCYAKVMENYNRNK